METIKDRVKVMNGYIVVDMIYVPPKNAGLAIINPFTELGTGSKENYEQHPFQLLVIKAPEFFYNGGIKYESEIKAGDILLVPGTPVTSGLDGWVIIDGIEYPLIKYLLTYMHYTPTEEELKNLKFVRDVQKEERAKQKSKILLAKEGQIIN
jgi:hypothetical protein